MNETSKSTSNPDDISYIVRSDWGVGPRTVAWDRLWHTIIADIGALPTADARESLESELGDA